MVIKKTSRTYLIDDLEKINQVIDLCIDRELYKELDQIIKLNEFANKFFEEFIAGDNSEDRFAKSFEGLPVTELILPIKLADHLRIKNRKITLQWSETNDDQLFKYWSYLFWAKKVRAEIQRNNKTKWHKLFDHIILFLENNIPPSDIKSIKKSFGSKRILNLTRFTYLMELSAVADREASYGYAERARLLLEVEEKILNLSEEKRELYDRWIWWNMGMAYQHMSGRNQKAILEFNRVIRIFFGKASKLKDKKKLLVRKSSNSLEFLVNILPATLQRAAINLKQQLSYHALQTLADSDSLLEEISKESLYPIYSKSISNLRLRIDLLRLEAFQQLSSYEDAKNLLKKLHKDIFKKKWSDRRPALQSVSSEPSSIAETQLVEQTVTFFLENTNRPKSFEKLIGDLKKISDNSSKSQTDNKQKISRQLASDIEKKANYLCKIIRSAKDIYWAWVDENPFDERIYFSRWAQFLKHGISSSYKLHQFTTKHASTNTVIKKIAPKLEKSAEVLLEATIELYNKHCERLPDIILSRHKDKKTLELESFRSDDLPDFVNGLSGFYKNMSSILLEKEENAIVDLKEKAEEFILRGPKKDDKPIDLLKRDHFQLLAALDEYHKEFGENQQIDALKRCNERLIWNETPVSVGPCSKCFENIDGTVKHDATLPKSFDGLLTCQKEIQRDQEDLPLDKRNRFDLYCYDYESIMQAAEKYFKKHLKSHSCQKPRKKVLHFMGLQRWNSLTPAQGRSVGGGYFIYRTNKEGEVDLGIAIDPGFDYVRNLFRMGFSLRDVDIVLISHAHPDHLWDFESMVQLLHELEDKESITHQLNVILTLGSYQRLAHIINNPELRRFINPLVIDIRKEIELDFFRKLAPDPDSETLNERPNNCFAFFDSNSPSNNSSESDNGKRKHWLPALPNIEERGKNTKIEIWPTRAYHDDYSERSDSFGFLIKFNGIPSGYNENKDFCFGYTGDTKWVCNDLYNKGCPGYDNDCEEKCSDDPPRWKDVASQYKKCDVLLMHLGSLIDHKNKKERKQFFRDYPSAKVCEELIRKKNHPYLMGMIRFLRELYEQQPENKKLILIGEFGEELRGGIRTDLVKRLRQGLTKKWRMLPVDVGLDILLHDYGNHRAQEGNSKISEFEFLCALCDKHRPISEIDYFKFGPDEAIFYTCKTCKKAHPIDVRDTRLRKLYEIGRELRTLPNSSR